MSDTAYAPPMEQDSTFTFRLSATARAALDQAAKSDKRKSAAMTRIIVEAWLREHGWLKDETK